MKKNKDMLGQIETVEKGSKFALGIGILGILGGVAKVMSKTMSKTYYEKEYERLINKGVVGRFIHRKEIEELEGKIGRK